MALSGVAGIRESFVRDCLAVCSNRRIICDILIDICYEKQSTKKFVWDLFPDVIIGNLLKKTGGVIHFPTKDVNGDVMYNGDMFSIKEAVILSEEV